MGEKIIMGADHGGFVLKEALKAYFDSLGVDVKDLGCSSEESCDYPDYAFKVSKKVAKGEGRGILICSTGIGMCMSANKVKGIRAALCYDEYTARMSREHNNANILCLGGRTTDEEMAKKIVKIWFETPFSNDERHKKRLQKISENEK